MNIGIDIDGVLTDLENYIKTVGKKYMIENNLGFDDTMNTNSICGFLSKEDSHQFWDTHWEKYATSIKVRENASNIIEKLKNDGNKIIIITARTYDSQIVKRGIKRQKNMEKLIIKWLDKNNIMYDKIVFSNLNKLKACLNNKIDIMIEDSISNIEQLKNHMKLLCFDAKYNHSYTNNQIYRVYKWDDVYNIISKI
ncbi:MAG: hypothetical protein HFI36_04780 [Bacilli bacterium]|jgi:uncharacterized HAD superfamily protein|nr:hypothetical protein [Bacilli bacterium]